MGLCPTGWHLKRFGLAVASALLASPSLADEAQSSRWDWYFGLMGGAALPAELAFTTGIGLSGDLGHNAGLALTGTFGKYLTDRLRAEVQFTYGKVDASTATGTLQPGPIPINTNAVGDIDVFKFMAAGAFDLDLGLPRLTPYVGAGVGVLVGRVDGMTIVGMPGVLHGTDVVPLVQVSAGVSYALSQQVDLVIDYTAEFGTPATLTFTSGLGDAPLQTRVFGHSVQAGFRVRLP